MTTQHILPAGTQLRHYGLNVPRQGLKLLFLFIGLGFFTLIFYWVLFPPTLHLIDGLPLEGLLRRSWLTMLRDAGLLVFIVFYALPYLIWLGISTCKFLWLNPTLDVFEHGIISRSRRGEQMWYWTDFDAFRAKLTPTPLLKYVGEFRFYRDEKRVFDISWDYHHMYELQHYALYYAREALWEKYEGMYLAGRMIKFGRTIQIDLAGIRHRQRFIEWSSVKGYRVAKNNLHIFGEDQMPIMKIPIGKMMNSNILLLLLEQITSPM